MTALAGAVILILVAALAVPPFVAWEGHRPFIDRTIGRSLGLSVRSEGRIAIRLLPSPRLRLDRLHLGTDPAKPVLDLRFVKAEVALAPLLTGEFRFTETRIGRAEVKLPVTEGEAVLVPADLSTALSGRDLAIEDLRIQQLLLTTQVPITGRTDQFYAEALRVSAPRLSGPWRAEGTSRGVPFRVATGEAAADGGVAVKISGGGDTQPRFEADARLILKPADGVTDVQSGFRAMVAEAEGSARIVVGPPVQAAGAYLPFALGGKFTARGPLVRFTEVGLDIDPSGPALRLAGTGRLDLRTWRAGLALEARRLDLDGFLLSGGGQAFVARGLPRGGAGLPVMLDVDLTVESLGLGLDDWSNLSASGTLDRTGGLILRKVQATAPGAAQIGVSGIVDTASAPRFTGHVSLDTPASDGIGRYLAKLGFAGPAVAVMDGQPIQAATDLSADTASLSFTNLRLALGEARISGNARYTASDGAARGRFDAQLVARGVDIATLPSFTATLAGVRGNDFGLILQARDVRYGPAGAHSGNGTIAASIRSEGQSLRVDSLDIANLAGANASLSGRIEADGTGQIAGRVSAQKAAPLFALLDRVWIAEARLVPAFLRDGALDLRVSLERDPKTADTLRVSANGSAAGGSLDLDLLTRAGGIEGIDLIVATPSTGRWFGRDDITALRRPGRLRIAGAGISAAAGEPVGLGVNLTGSIADLVIATAEPIVLDTQAAAPRTGTVRLATPDLAPFLTLAGSAAAIPGPLATDLTIRFGRTGPDARAEMSGRIAGSAVSASITRAPDGDIGGSAGFERLSLPWLAAALVIPTEGRRDEASARFGPPPPVRPPVDLALRVESLDLGRGLVATKAALGLRLDDGALTVRDIAATLAGGQLTGGLTLARQGGAATVSGEGTLADASLADLLGGGPVAGRLGTVLRFGSSGDSASALVNNLGGSGTLTLTGLTVPGADPAGLDRALARALSDDDPLREGRLQALVAEDLSAGPLVAKRPVSAPATLVGGSLRAGPLAFDLGTGRWNGTLGLDLRTGRLDARGTLTGTSSPKGWTGAMPAIQLGFAGPFARPERSVDTGPLTTGLAAVVLQRELEKIELFEADQIERLRRRARLDMDKARIVALKVAADKAAAEKAAADETARQRARQIAAEEAARRGRAESETAPQGVQP
nr:AsmA family protein [Methylobacterium sp. BTF04]